MNTLTSEARTSTIDVLQRTDPDTIQPVVTPYPVADKVLVVPEIPRGGTVAPLDPKAGPPAAQAPLSPDTGSLAELLNRADSEQFRTRWNEIQGKFVDQPRVAVQEADGLVSEVIAQITQMFADEHSTLESQWHQGQEVSSEDFRQALLRYRSFFNRLVV
jgi:hypothetical protein